MADVMHCMMAVSGEVVQVLGVESGYLFLAVSDPLCDYGQNIYIIYLFPFLSGWSVISNLVKL